MTRESKLALIIGFVLVLVVGVLVSDHFSQASSMTLDIQQPDAGSALAPITDLGQREKNGLDAALNTALGDRQIASNQPNQIPPVTIHSNGQGAVGSNGSLIDRALEEAKRRVQDTELPKAAQLVDNTKSSNEPTGVRRLAPVQYSLYRVVAGDTLIGIARRQLGNSERWTQIHQLNADILGPDAILKIGMKLNLPIDANTNLQPGTTPARTSVTSGTVYTVVAGDTLGEISMSQLGTSRRADEIAQLNNLESPDDIRVGMKLRIPAK